MLKFIQPEIGKGEKNSFSPETLRFRAEPAQQGTFCGKLTPLDGFIYDFSEFASGILGGQIPLQLKELRIGSF